jgi:hypothetical protein
MCNTRLISRVAFLGVAGLLACSETSSYVYQPSAPNDNLHGLPAERIGIPQEAPQGTVEVASYGVTNLRTNDGEIPVAHVRMVVSNESDATPWTIDSRKQMLEIAGEGRSRAIYVNSDRDSLPVLSITQRERRVLDFYFPLPSTVRSDAGLRRFDMLWEVDTGSRAVASRTSFDRVAEQPQYAYAEPYSVFWPGYGPYWWYDPFFPNFVFVHSRHFAVRHPGPVTVGHFGGRFHPSGHVVAHGRR